MSNKFKKKAVANPVFDDTGPSSSQTPYVVPVADNVEIASILSVGDAVGTKDGPAGLAGQPYRMVGIPDGLGAYDNSDGTITILMNHELGATAGVPREHGQVGSFVSKLTVDKDTLQVLKAEDLVQDVFFYNRDTNSYVEDVPHLGTAQFGRLCSADLAPVSAFFDANSGLGTTDRIYLNGEEIGNEGRAFAHVVSGTEAGSSYELAALGRMSFENSLANPASGKKTVVISTDDSTPGEVYLYVGDKQAIGSAVERAGLTNGDLFGIFSPSFGDDTAATPQAGTFQLVPQGTNGDVTDTTGTQLQAQSGFLTQFGRPEDGQWDPSNPNVFYFLTTGATVQGVAIPTRLWRMEFNDVEHPELGGTIKVVVEGGLTNSTDQNVPVMLDNMTVTESGLVIMQEDPGNNSRLAKIWIYDPAKDTQELGGTSGLTLVAQHDPARFSNPSGPTATPAPGSTTGFGQDEESSGIIDVTGMLSQDKLAFVFDTQAHYSIGGELVEGGQLMAMYVDLPNAGDSRFNGGGGSDTYDGGFGDDRINGGNGNDTLFGNYGADDINGGNGNDHLKGGVGDDQISGADGHDNIDGGTGNDVIGGGAGNDTAAGGVGDDTISGGDGRDMLSGGFGNDSIQGAADNDTLEGNQGYDNLNGGSGADILAGGSGIDTLTGGSGSDSFLFRRADEGGDLITDFRSGGDRIVLDFDVAPSGVAFIGFNGPDDMIGNGPALIYYDGTGVLKWDATGGDLADAVVLATLVTSPELDRGDIFIV